MEHVCINCEYFEENICVLHSVGYEALVRYPKSHSCNDFEPREITETYENEGVET